MHVLGGEEWKQRRHMWPVPATATTVAPAADSSSSEYIRKDGREIRVGDCALFKPPQDSPPFIGIIRKLTLKKEESPSLEVNWLYRPADLKLAKGIQLEAAPNEVFYSFHKDETPAASLLHPCKVAFLRKGVELPSGISAFVCRRVYDIESERLWWLTDKDYINERQEEVDQLLDKTRLEMHGAVQSGGRSPKPLNGPTSTPSLKSGSDSVQNSSSFGSQGKGKKRERCDQGSDSCKREQLIKTEDGDTGQHRPENMLKSEIAKITENGGLVDFEGVERLVQLMQPDSADKKIDLAGRVMLADVIAVTDRFECLGWFVQLRGLPVLDEWLQEVHKGKTGDGNTPKESDKPVEELLLALLRALDKLPVNLHALQTCNVGKSVNHLRTHKNSEIQKKARSLVDTWKKRVEAEMNINDSKSGSNRGVSWPAKPASSEVSHVGSRKTGGSAEVAAKSSTMLPSASKNSQAKISSGESLSKLSPSSTSTKATTTSVACNSKEQNFKAGGGTSDLPLTPIKEERSSSSSQSQNNSLSCSSEHAKTIGSCREDARSSTAVSMNASKIPGSASRSRKSSNGMHGSALTAVQKESHSGKNLSRNSTSEKASPNHPAHEKSPDVPLPDHGSNQRLIVRLPNTGRSPVWGAGGGSEDPAIVPDKASPPGDKHENVDRRVKSKTDGSQINHISNMATNVCNASEAVADCERGNDSPTGDGCRPSEGGDKLTESSKPISSSGFLSRSGQTYDASLSSINALIESCVKFSEANSSVSPVDDAGMNLLATVAAGEISRSENVTPAVSPGRKSPAADESCSGNNDSKLQHSGEAVACTLEQLKGGATEAHVNTVDSLPLKNDAKHTVGSRSCDLSGDGESTQSGCKEKTVDGKNQMNSSPKDLSHNVEGPFLGPENKEEASETALPAKKENVAEPEGVSPLHEQRKLETRWGKSSNNTDSKIKTRTLVDEDSRVDHVSGMKMENEVSVCEGSHVTPKIEKEVCEKSPQSSTGLVNENQISGEKVAGSIISLHKHESIEGRNENVVVPPSAPSYPLMESKAVSTVDVKPCEVENSKERQRDLGSSGPALNSKCTAENLDRKEAFGLSVDSSVQSESPKNSVHDNEVLRKPSGFNLDRVASDGAAEQHASGSHHLDFDLNEGFPVDDMNQGEVKQEEPSTSSAVHIPCPLLPFPVSSMSGGFHASITVASAAKRPFIPPDPLRNKELRWKGSAATSAFRPAEPRKNTEQPLNTSDSAAKQGRAPLDFDLNVPDQRSFDDVTSHGSSETCLESLPRDRGTAGLDLDLNRVDETPDSGCFPVSKLDIPSLPTKPSLSGGLSSGGNVSRDFDLNNGPGLDDVGTEAPARSQQIKSTVPLPLNVHGVRTNSTDFGNYSSWFPSGTSYPAINVPPLLPGREQSFVAGPGAQRMLGPPGSSSFGPEIYRGAVLSSSPAVAYPSSTPFQYPGFPFETNFPLSSSSFSGCSTPFMDSSTAGGLCFPTMPSQLVGPGGVVSSNFPRPYVMSLPGGTSNMLPESRKWGGQSLDLNSGPGGADTERRDDRLPSGLRQPPVSSSQALMEEQMKMFQVAGGVLKRKEPDGGWDGADRYSSYKQPSWQ